MEFGGGSRCVGWVHFFVSLRIVSFASNISKMDRKKISSYIRHDEAIWSWGKTAFENLRQGRWQNILKRRSLREKIIKSTKQQLCGHLLPSHKTFMLFGGLVAFYGISTVLGYLMPNPVYIFKYKIYDLFVGNIFKLVSAYLFAHS